MWNVSYNKDGKLSEENAGSRGGHTLETHSVTCALQTTEII